MEIPWITQEIEKTKEVKDGTSKMRQLGLRASSKSFLWSLYDLEFG